MSFTVDANILVYASNASVPEHEPALRLVERMAAGPDIAYLFWPASLGYLRLVTHPAILPNPLSSDEARGNIGALIARPHIRTPGEGPAFWERFSETTWSLRGNDVPDAHLVALMREHGVRTIYTRDRGFRRFSGIEAKDPTD